MNTDQIYCILSHLRLIQHRLGVSCMIMNIAIKLTAFTITQTFETE